MPRTHLSGSSSASGPSHSPDLTGQRLAGRYRLVRRAGAGGMSVVYLALDARNGDEPVALKVSSRPSHAARLEREARVLRRLRGPLFPRVIEDGQLPEGRSYLVLEWLEGETLAARLGHGSVEPTDLIDVILDVASAIEAAHAAGIVHRDLKPDNVFLCRDGQVKLLDFGLALVAGELRMTDAAERPGTRAFMAPEQVLAPHLVDVRADIYGMAMLLRAVLGGQSALPVIDGLEPARYLEALGARPALDTCLAGVPAALRAVIARAEATVPAARFQRMTDMRVALVLAADALEAEEDGGDGREVADLRDRECEDIECAGAETIASASVVTPPVRPTGGLMATVSPAVSNAF